MTIKEIKKVCVLGAGTMGCRISLECAIRGYPCVVYDISPEARQRAPERQRMMAATQVFQGTLKPEEVEQGLTRITFTSDPKKAADNADLLSESVPEILKLKRKVHAQFDQLCPPKTIVTTNSSSLLVSEIEDAVQRGDRFAAMHFHGFGSVVDLVRGPRTSPQTMDILKRFVKSLSEVPIVLKKEKDGYLHNTMYIAFLQSAVALAAGGYGDIEDIDRSWMAVHKSPAGPFGMMDGVGLDVALNVAEAQSRRRRIKGFKEMADFLRTYVERGELGVKTGKGFYSYPDAAYLRPDFLKGGNA
jgi:3-hydroxybutyryl-CoA dehydrogenase